MSPITHFLAGWAIANSSTINKRDRLLATLAGVVPDIDGLGVIGDILSRKGSFEFYQQYHHLFCHNIFFSLLVAASGLALGARKRLVGALMFVSFHLHLIGDLVGSRGQGDDYWAVSYFWPVSVKTFSWQGQWQLNGWQNFLITGILLVFMFHWARSRGYSPVEFLSPKADRVFVEAVRGRF